MAFLTFRASSSPTIPTVTTVSTTGLTNLQVDGNFASLDSAKYEKTGGAISGDVAITGSLSTSGNSVTINSTNVLVSDNNISIGSVVAVNALSGAISNNAGSGSAWTATVTMTSPSTTAGLIPGTILTKTTGVGIFGANAVITSVVSLTQMTISSTSTNTNGALSFNTGVASDLTANGGGITLKSVIDKSIIWDSTNSNWTSSENWNIVTGKEFKINNVSVLNATTLGSVITSSSLTSVGTIATGTWTANTIASAYGGTGYSTYAAGDILYASATNVLSKLPKATNGNVLMLVAGVPAWAAEADTLATVTGRGATTATALTITNATSSALTVTGGVTIGGDLVVNGTTTSINSTILTVDDKNIELGFASALTNLSGSIVTSAIASALTMTSTAGLIPGMVLTKVSGTGVFGGVTTITSVDSATQITIGGTTANTLGALVFNAGGVSDLTANGGGITLKGTSDKTISWDSTNSNWSSSEHWNIATGKSFKINNTAVLSAGSVNVANGTFTTITLGTAGINATNGYNISGTQNGGAIEIRTNGGTTDRGWRLGMRDAGSGFTEHVSYLESAGNVVKFFTNITATGTIDGTTFNSTSDVRLKSEIEVIENALDKTLSLNGYTFLLNSDKSKRQTGLLAQEVLKVLPEAVSGTEDTHYSVSYGNVVGLLIEAIKELNTKVTDLQNQLANK